jgi:2-isopropylmalate synthase
MMDPDQRVVVFDTTLRDAEQTPGAKLAIREKIEIAHQLARLNVDVIEAGFPCSSQEDFQAVQTIAQEVEGPVICGLARALNKDIEAAGEALKGGARTRLHTFIGTSPNHIEMVRKAPSEVLDMAVEAVKLAKSYCDDVEFSPMDATRTEPGFLYDVVQATIEAGATTVNIPDTVGYAVPEQFGVLIDGIRKNVPNIGDAVISVHCHDDLGMAVSNTLAALKNGARQAECTINGLGERAGNASLEEIVMALRTRGEYFGLFTEVNPKEICPTSRMVSRLMGIGVAPNKAIVGANAFAHSSGIHQDGVLKKRDNFEIIAPEDVGLESTQIVLTARSGRHALRHRLEQLGQRLSQDDLDRTYERFLVVADKKKEVYDEDLMAIVGDEIRDIPEVYRLEYLHTISGTGTVPSATVRVRVEGKGEVQHAAWGDGPVDATYKAIALATSTAVSVEDYTIRAVTGGAEAMGEVIVKLAENGANATGRGASTDIIEASGKAYIDALNRLAMRVAAQPERAEGV